MRSIFVSAKGQEDNVGDSLLRRGYLDTLRRAGSLHVLVSDDDGYNTGLGLSAGDVQYRSRDAWRRAAMAGSLRGDMAFALNAGEATLDPNYARYCARLAGFAMVGKVRGVKFAIAGSGFRPGVSVAPRAVRAIARVSDFVAWRDEESQSAAGRGSVAPDWAFGLGKPSSALMSPERADNRDLLAVSVRAAGPQLEYQRGQQIKDLARRSGLDPVVVVQVGRDNEAAQAVARTHGFGCLPWREGAHLQREADVRALYSRSRAVISNRVHALIIGLTEGAAPLAPSEMGVEKVERIFRAAGIENLTIDTDRPITTAALERTEAACFVGLTSARSALEHAAGNLVSTLRTDPGIDADDPTATRRPAAGDTDPDVFDRTLHPREYAATLHTGSGDG